MKKPLVLAALAAMILIGAAYPEFDKPDGDDSGYAERADRGGARTYRPCRSRRDDNCIQLYERGVRASYARWLGVDPDDRRVRMASARHRGQRMQVAARAHPRQRVRQIAQARPHPRLTYAAAQPRCAPLARRSVRTARAAPAPAPARRPSPAAPPAHRPRDDMRSGVRGM